MLRIKNLESGYGRLKVLKKVTMHIRQGEIVTIIGANGAGKTSLLRTVSGLIRARSGEILFDMKDIGELSPEKIVFLGCSLVPEGRQVFAPLTVRENILLGAYPQLRKKRGAAVRDDIERVYGIFPRLKEREKQLAGTLSGGEQQMLAIARALMARPKLIMMDEPSMGLAPLIMKDIFSVITRLRKEGNTVLLVEQNAKAALAIADRGYVIETGRIVMEGTAEDLLSNREVQRAYLGRDLDAEGTM
ncbi:MAG: Branched-chain amino acid ABC transporter ATP-binding protein [Actinobacteria bacterium]|nr:Branched-chain amino acid ABC transporter ATP-binding protein [Actinomycetota bacterium]